MLFRFKSCSSLAFLAFASLLSAQSPQLWFDHGAAGWDEALPIGNGRLAVMVFGGVEQEHLQLNEETIYAGSRRDRVNPEARAAVPVVRRLLLEGKVKEAEAIADKSLLAVPRRQPPYEPLGDLTVTFEGRRSAVSAYGVRSTCSKVLRPSRLQITASITRGRRSLRIPIRPSFCIWRQIGLAPCLFGLPSAALPMRVRASINRSARTHSCCEGKPCRPHSKGAHLMRAKRIPVSRSQERCEWRQRAAQSTRRTTNWL